MKISPQKNTMEPSEEAQIAALNDVLTYVDVNSKYYREKFIECAIDIGQIRTKDDFLKIPVTTKDDLQARNSDFFCVSSQKIIDYCSTSGTLGKPVTVPLSERDLERLAINEYRSFIGAGITDKDVIQLMLSLDRQFMAGFAYLLGARKIGAGIIRGGPGNAAMQMDLIRKLNSTVIVAVPSFVLSIVAYAFDNNIDLNKLPVRKIICIGENIRDEDFLFNSIAVRILKNWNIELYSTYASSEMQTAFTECIHGRGGHHQSDLIYAEVLDQHDNPVLPGEYGELTITTFGVEAMPLVRYKTGDICRFYFEKCPCGQSGYRISPIVGRKQQLIKYKGTSLYPQTVFNALDGNDLISDYLIKVFKNDMGTDDLEVIVSTSGDRESVLKRLKETLQSKLRITPKIIFDDPASIQKMQVQDGKRKGSRFFDAR